MKLLHLSEQVALTVELEGSSLAVLLERGLQCVRQRLYAEGTAFFALAREQLSSDYACIASILDALIQSSTNYRSAQQALHEASKRFAETDSTQQAQVEALEKLLPTLTEKTASVPYAIAQLPTDSQDYQPLQLLQTPIANSIDYQALAKPQVLPENRDALPALYFTCFGHFEVRRLNQTIALCSNRNGRAILRYLTAQPRHCVTIETLMAMLWPEDEPEIAQPKLHNAVCALRRSLNHGYNCEPGRGYILCKNRVYHLNPKVAIQTDVDQFLQCYQARQQISEERVALYERACRLYTGPFLSEDIYADWSFLRREQLSRTYLAMCRELADYYFNSKCYGDAVKWATAMLKENHCDEVAHQFLMQIYAAQDRRSEALQQYQHCERMLREDLGVSPLPKTADIFQKILTSEPSPANQAKI